MSSIPLPPQELRFMGEDDEKFALIGDHHLAGARKHVNPARVLDIGCGYGRLAYALHRNGFRGRYLGVDILARHIRWLSDNFTAADDRYRFEHLDVRNGRYNPKGKLDPKDVDFSGFGYSPDLTLVLSVFTHMYEEDIEIYLKRLRAILEPGSVVYATFFTTNNGARRGMDLKFARNDHCHYLTESDPLHVIAYDEKWLRAMLSGAGFLFARFEYGHQDAIALTPA